MHKAYNFVRAACVRVRAGNKAKKRENVSMKLFSFFLSITHTRKHTHSHTQHTHCFSPSHTLFLSFKPILFSFECLGTKLRVQHKSHLQKSNQVSSYDRYYYILHPLFSEYALSCDSNFFHSPLFGNTMVLTASSLPIPLPSCKSQCGCG